MRFSSGVPILPERLFVLYFLDPLRVKRKGILLRRRLSPCGWLFLQFRGFRGEVSSLKYLQAFVVAERSFGRRCEERSCVESVGGVG